MHPVTQLQAREDLMVASGRALLITDRLGRIDGQGLHGLYVDNARLLSLLRVLVDRQPVDFFAASPAGDARLLAYGAVPQTERVPASALYLEMHAHVSMGMAVELRFANHGQEPLEAPVRIELAADYADTQEVQQGERQQEAPVEVSWDDAAVTVHLDYGHSDLEMGTRVRIESAPTKPRWDDGGLMLQMSLATHTCSAAMRSPSPGRLRWRCRRWRPTRCGRMRRTRGGASTTGGTRSPAR